eukprot:7327129-Alexandrium_andersonii.AAC.1
MQRLLALVERGCPSPGASVKQPIAQDSGDPVPMTCVQPSPAPWPDVSVMDTSSDEEAPLVPAPAPEP